MIDDFLKETMENESISATEKSMILKNIYDSKKAIADAEKTQADSNNLKKTQPNETAKLLISTIAPLITAFALIATLWFQINQDKTNIANKIQADEDAAWRETLEQVGSKNAGENLTLPTLIASFNSSKKYGSQSKEIGTLFLGNIMEYNYFKILFKNFKNSSNWNDFEQLVTLSRILRNQYLIAQAEKDVYRRDTFQKEINYVGIEIINFLERNKNTRPKTIDLSEVFFTCQILDDVDFSGTTLTGTIFHNCSVKNADFSNIGEFQNSFAYCTWEQTAWWRAKKIDSKLLAYLKKWYPKDTLGYFHPVNDTYDYTKSDNEKYALYLADTISRRN